MKSLPNSIRPRPKHFYVPNQLDIVKPIKPTGHRTLQKNVQYLRLPLVSSSKLNRNNNYR